MVGLDGTLRAEHLGFVSQILLKERRLWKTDLHMLGLRFPHPLHIVGRVSIRAVFHQNLP